MNARAWVVVIGSLAVAAIGACKGGASAGGGAPAGTAAVTAPPAELEPSSGSGGTCQSQGDAVVITVTNNAAADAPATFTRVEFSPTNSMAWTVPTPKIKKGANVQLSVAMPSDCHGATCTVKISTDFTKAMSKAGGKTASCHG
jgi:hypothetical protein